MSVARSSRRRELELEPANDVAVVPGGFEVRGAAPQIVARPATGAQPSGWVVVEHDAGAPYTLLFDQGRGADRPGRCRVAPARGRRGLHLVGLPPSSLPLRLVPDSRVRQFRLTKVAVHELGPWSLFLFLLGWRRREDGVWASIKDLTRAIRSVTRGPGSALIRARLDDQRELVAEPASADGMEPRPAAERGDARERAAHRERARAWLAAFLTEGRPLAFPPVRDPDVSVVVVVRDHADLTLACLRSLADQEGVSVEVLIHDNASSDQTAALLALVEGAKVSRSGENLGFVRAVNQTAARATGGALLLLNNDVELDGGALGAALRTLNAQPDVGAVGARTVLYDGTLQEAGSIVWRDGSCLGYGRGGDPDGAPYRFRRDVDFCSGVFLMIRRALWERLGGFDLAYEPAYYEEVDFCLRARAAGWRVVYEPEALVRHYEFASAGEAQAVLLQRRNQARLLARHSAVLQARLDPAPANVLSARTARGDGRRILVLDDVVPHPFEGSGSPRLRAILGLLLEAGFEVTFYPTQFPDEDWRVVYQAVPREVEVAVAWGAARLEEFLGERSGFYRALFVSRPHNLGMVASIRERKPAWFEGVRLVYDAEALFAMRGVAAAALRGDRSAAARAERELGDEIGLARLADRVSAASQRECELLARRGVGDVVVLPHAIEAAPTPRPFAQRHGFLVVGPLAPGPTPNVDGVEWLLDRVLPRLRERLPRCEVVVVGRNENPALARRRDPGARFVGTVEELAPIYDSARVFVAPTRFSAGVPLKILEAAAHGLPVVTTDLLAEQLGWSRERDLLSSPVDDAEAFADNCARLAGDAELWERLRAGALERVRAECDPRRAAAALRGLLDGIEARAF